MCETVFFTFHDEIKYESANRLMSFCANAIQQHNPKNFYFLFSSGGGAVDSGVTIYNYLKGLSQKIIMHNIGSIDSIANAIFLAGDERYATPISSFLLHGIVWNFPQPTTQTYSQMREIISRFDSAEQLSAQIIEKHTKLTATEVRGLFKQGESKDLQFALEKGFIHEIREVSIPNGVPLYSIAAAVR